MLTKQSKWFFGIFLGLIVLSVSYTFYDTVLEKRFEVFVSEGEVPTSADAWRDLIGKIDLHE